MVHRGCWDFVVLASMKRGSCFSRTGRAQLALRPWRKWRLSRRTGASVCVSLRSLLSFLFSPSPFLSMSASVLCASPRRPDSPKPSVGNMCGGQAKSKDTAHPRRLLEAAQDFRRSAAAPSWWGRSAWVLGDWTCYSCALGWVCV